MGWNLERVQNSRWQFHLPPFSVLSLRQQLTFSLKFQINTRTEFALKCRFETVCWCAFYMFWCTNLVKSKNCYSSRTAIWIHAKFGKCITAPYSGTILKPSVFFIYIKVYPGSLTKKNISAATAECVDLYLIEIECLRNRNKSGKEKWWLEERGGWGGGIPEGEVVSGSRTTLISECMGPPNWNFHILY